MPPMTFEEYSSIVRTKTNHTKKHLQKPKDFSKLKYHLDHIISIWFGYNNGIDPNLLSMPENLQYITEDENLTKGEGLDDSGRILLGKWLSEDKVDAGLKFYVGEVNHESGLPEGMDSKIYKQIVDQNDGSTPFMLTIPANVAHKFPAVEIQRAHEYRWEKTKRAIGTISLPTHAIMQFTIMDDPNKEGRKIIERVDGNTRTYIFSNGLQFPSYNAPKDYHCIFFPVKNAAERDAIYHSIDGYLTAETFADKVSGVLRQKGLLQSKLPTQFKKGEKVYDTAVVVMDGYIAPNEKEEQTISFSKDFAEKSKMVGEKLDYFIDELINLGVMIRTDSIPRELTSPMMGTLIRYLMVDKSKECEDKVLEVVTLASNKHRSLFQRPMIDNGPTKDNFFIMLDELGYYNEENPMTNPHLAKIGVTESVRRIVPKTTKTTVNTMDRRLYCGWIMYCMDKTLNGEAIHEDIIFDITGKHITDETKTSDAKIILDNAKSKIISTYDNFWKTHKTE